MNIFALWGEIEINRRKAETDIKAVEKQATTSGKQMETSFDKVTKVVGAAIKEVDKYGKKVAQVGENMAKKAGVPLAALTALMGGLAKSTADYGDQVAKQAQEVGLNTTAYQELTYAMGQNNLSQEDSLRILGRLNQRVGLARSGNENYRKSLKKMGVDLEALDKGLVGTEEAFGHILEYLSEMPDSQMQAAYASEIFGTQVSRKMMPMIKAGAEGIAELRDRAHELGIVMDEEATKRAEQFGDTMSDLKGTMGGFNRSIGKELFAPLMNIANWMMKIISAGTEWVKENPKLVRQIIIWGGAIAGVLGVLVTLGTTLVITGKIIGALGTVMGILTSKPFLIIAALGLLWLAWEQDWGNIKTTTETVVTAILALWDSLVDWWENDPLIQAIKQAWADVVETWEGLTLPEKALGVVAVAATITWALTFLQSFLAALLPKAGITAASGVLAGGAKFLFTLGALVVTAKIIWDLLPEGLQGDVKDLWTKVGEEIEKFNTETLNNPFIAGIATWLQNLDEEGWTIPTLTVTVLFMAFKLFQKGLILAATLGKAIGATLGATAIPLLGVSVALGAITWLFAKDEEREKLLKKIEEIWGDEELSTVVKLGQITVEVAKWVFPNLVDVLDEHIFAPVRAALGMEKSKEGELMQDYLLADETGRAKIVGDLREATKDAGATFEKAPTWWEKFLRWIGVVEEAPETIRSTTDEVEGLIGELKTLGDLLDSIDRAEGRGRKDGILYGMTSYAGRDVSYFSPVDQARWEELSEGLEKDSEPYWRAAAQTTVESYWRHFQNKFPEVAGESFDEVGPDMQQMFITYLGAWFSPPSASDLNINWVPNVLSFMDFDELSKGFRNGFGNVLDTMEQAVYDKAKDHETAADFLAKIYADRLIGQSPPPEGPLADIEEGGANVMEAWVEGAEGGLKDGVPVLSSMLEKIRGLFSSIWDKVPDDIKAPIETAIGYVGGLIDQAEEALWKLDELEKQLGDVLGTGGDPGGQAQGFMDKLTAGLNDKLDQLDAPMERFTNAVYQAGGTLFEFGKALASGNYLDAFLIILMETESFAKAMELLGAVLDPVIALLDAVLGPMINFLLKLWNGIIDALASISIFGWKPFGGLKDKKIGLVGEGDGGGGDDKGRGGRQVSEITGPTRDLLVDLLSPLANFGQVIAPVQDIRNILYERLPNFNNMDFAGAGAGSMGGVVFESGSIVIHSPATNSAELSRNLLDQIEREMARRFVVGQRGRGGR